MSPRPFYDQEKNFLGRVLFRDSPRLAWGIPFISAKNFFRCRSKIFAGCRSYVRGKCNPFGRAVLHREHARTGASVRSMCCRVLSWEQHGTNTSEPCKNVTFLRSPARLVGVAGVPYAARCRRRKEVLSMESTATVPTFEGGEAGGGSPAPPGSASRRTRTVAVRVSDAEFARWERAARDAGRVTLGRFVREVVNANLENLSSVGVNSREDLDVFVSQLARVGNNLNQVARAANVRVDVSEEARDLFVAVRRLVREVSRVIED